MRDPVTILRRALARQRFSYAGPPDLPPTAGPSGLGVCRLFVGLRRARRDGEALATAHGFSDEPSLYGGLDTLRRGDVGDRLGIDERDVLFQAPLAARGHGEPLSG